jgi:hypothetical protein
VLIIAKGFPNLYGSVSKELALSQADSWFPTNDDFRATARFSGGAGEAATFKELIELIGKEKVNSIKDLGLIGHANENAFALGGRVVGNGMIFSEPGLLYDGSITDNLEAIKKVRDRFTRGPDTSITIFACDAGAGTRFLKSMADAFEVCVKGFSHPLWWCFEPTKGGALRGKTWYDGVGATVHPKCSSTWFTRDIRTWIPENKSCGSFRARWLRSEEFGSSE